MEKIYNPQQIEQHWYQQWESSGVFKPQGEGKPYCIMIPPPNVTGVLHMGHAFQVSLMDNLIRYHRMLGENVLWQVGTDHAGIATQMVVERRLENQGIKRSELPREEFIEKVWEWKHESGNQITQQLRRLGASPDWSRECFTMDEELSYAVREAFIKLYEKGLIYKGKRLVNWDPVLQTAVSDLEVVTEEEAGKLWYLKYPLSQAIDEKNPNHVVVATTRPETLLGDMAVAVNPEDSRYQHLIGHLIDLPLTPRKIPIIADTHVDPEFGSGCVKITPAHDFNDYEVGKRHGLHKSADPNIIEIGSEQNFDAINIFDKQAYLNEQVPDAYQGLERYDARSKILADLKSLNLLVQEKDYRMHIPRGDRSHSVIEPLLTEQWFVRTHGLAHAAIKAVQTQEIKFIPERWQQTYFAWLEQIQDWCISRQLWWGHRIPVWYDEAGNVYAGHSESDVRKRYKLGATLTLTQDDDVLDTWFSSALWPFSTLGWPHKSLELKCFFPTNILVTGFDIIFFWVARMVMMSLELTEEIPFKEVYVHGLVRDAKGQKMSKSKGNILDPIDLIAGISSGDLIRKRTANLMQPKLADQIELDTKKQYPQGIKAYGTDALRFMFTVMASTGRDIRFDTKRLEGYRNFCNKLWNAARFTTLLCENKTLNLNTADADSLELYSEPDRWIQMRLGQTLKKIKQHYKTCRFDLIASLLYEFVWHDFCDWYLEIVKLIQASDAKPELKDRNLACLITTLNHTLKVLHPIIPFITEEIWHQLKPLTGDTGDSIQTQAYPELPHCQDTTAEQTMALLQSYVGSIRQVRSEMNISPAVKVPVLMQGYAEPDRLLFEQYGEIINALAKISTVQYLSDDANPPPSATVLVGAVKVLIPIEGLIDIKEEQARLKSESTKISQSIAKLQERIADKNFINNAPPEIVGKQKETLQTMQMQLEKYNTQLASLGDGS